MPGTLVLILFLAAAFIAAAKLGLLKKGRGGQADHWPVFPKKVLTPVEQQLYQRLIRAYPDRIVLAQVSLSQIIGVKKGHNFKAIWNRYKLPRSSSWTTDPTITRLARTLIAAKPQSVMPPESHCTA